MLLSRWNTATPYKNVLVRRQLQDFCSKVAFLTVFGWYTDEALQSNFKLSDIGVAAVPDQYAKWFFTKVNFRVKSASMTRAVPASALALLQQRAELKVS